MRHSKFFSAVKKKGGREEKNLENSEWKVMGYRIIRCWKWKNHLSTSAGVGG